MRLLKLLSIVAVAVTLMSCVGFIEGSAYPGYVAPRTILPSGSYAETCSDCTIAFGELKCWCRDLRNLRNFTTIVMNQCSGTIRNNNGRLECHLAPKPLPRGSYQQSCTNCSISGDMLSCSCPSVDGFSRYSSLNTRFCYDAISNQNGNLKCGEYTPPPPPRAPVIRPLPRGSYQSTCTGCSISGDILSCSSCSSLNGFSRYTTLNTRYCYESISNQDGNLKCGEYTPPPPPPPRPPVVRSLPRGSYQGSCTGCTMSGDVLSCSCKNEDGYSKYTSMNTGSCFSSISNQNGNLTCGEYSAPSRPSPRPSIPSAPSMPQGTPQGSYKQSCSNCSVMNNRLECLCKDERGVSRSASLSLFGCYSSVSNCNGRLVCGGC